jgi:hypothetical protein
LELPSGFADLDGVVNRRGYVGIRRRFRRRLSEFCDNSRSTLLHFDETGELDKDPGHTHTIRDRAGCS